ETISHEKAPSCVLFVPTSKTRLRVLKHSGFRRVLKRKWVPTSKTRLRVLKLLWRNRSCLKYQGSNEQDPIEGTETKTPVYEWRVRCYVPTSNTRLRVLKPDTGELPRSRAALFQRARP